MTQQKGPLFKRLELNLTLHLLYCRPRICLCKLHRSLQSSNHVVSVLGTTLEKPTNPQDIPKPSTSQFTKQTLEILLTGLHYEYKIKMELTKFRANPPTYSYNVN
ncbi:hypothetical protein V6Z11_D01G129800 [Gossypium hirsutum]